MSVVFQADLVQYVGEQSEEAVEVDFFLLDDLPERLFQPDVPIIERLFLKE